MTGLSASLTLLETRLRPLVKEQVSRLKSLIRFWQTDMAITLLLHLLGGLMLAQALLALLILGLMVALLVVS
jgi:hypothetical protein